MPSFYYVARNQAGVKETGMEEALTPEDAVVKIQAKGLIVVNVIPADLNLFDGSMKEASIKLRIKPKHARVTAEDLMLYCRQLSTLIGAGVTILMSLEIIAKQVASKKLYDVSMDLKKNMEAGLSFHEALAMHPKIFSDLWINLVESGEASGNLAVVLSRLAEYLEKDAEFKKKIISALIYPAILTLAGFGALLFLSLKIVPSFAEIFKSFNLVLPLLTQVLVGISDFLKKYLFLLILLIAGGFYVFQEYIKTKSGRRNFEKFQLSLPIFGEFFLALYVERFTSGMSTLLESGVPILYSLEISERSVDNLIMAEIIHRIKNDVRDGKSMRDAFGRSNFFEPMVIQMVSIGEEIGELPQMFKRINTFYQGYCDMFLARFISMFEPFVLVFIGGIIGVMVIGMFLPIFELSKING